MEAVTAASYMGTSCTNAPTQLRGRTVEMRSEAYVTARADGRHCSTTLQSRRTCPQKLTDYDGFVTMRDKSVASGSSLVLAETQSSEIARKGPSTGAHACLRNIATAWPR